MSDSWDDLTGIERADLLRYIARERRTNLELGLHRKNRASRDNVAVYDGHKPNTYRAFPRTHYSDPSREEGTSPNMFVTLADGSKHCVPAIPSWRSHIKRATIHEDTRVDTARVNHGHNYADE
jgi:hypothetical protein